MPDKVHLCGMCRMNQKGHGRAGTFFGFFLGVQGSNSIEPGVLPSLGFVPVPSLNVFGVLLAVRKPRSS